MKLHLIFVGNKFIYNNSLKEYVQRSISKSFDFIDNITFFKESDNTLFLHLDALLNTDLKLIIVTSKQNFSTIGKVICTITEDNQVLKDTMLIPSESYVYEKGSYLLEYKQSTINVIHVDEMQKFPKLLLESDNSKEVLNIFEEDEESLRAILNPMAQTYDLRLDIFTLVEGWIQVNITSKKYGEISKFIKSAKQLLPSKIIQTEDMATYIIQKLTHYNKKITFAESCTGGLLSYYFTSKNGASNILDGALVTYSNEIKANWLAVEESTLEEYGAVSAPVVKEMAEGAINVSEADYALSISGIAGDTGGTVEKPVGTVFIGIKNNKASLEMHLQLSGDRNYVQNQSVLYAVKLLLLSDKDIFFEI
ncbi:CinA family protein [Sulfurimonas lithotrophica]|uniref:CinA family protein n=1 Tax=Sulfurimonas lithotrophica TaxID=2590022 RepID=A0A5P8P1Q3_9BACT|nr:CinA family protein [Sulfurimonas lithotrophica]QFR49629.1 CinA family protein [Sulfurimonas lithotrophica]